MHVSGLSHSESFSAFSHIHSLTATHTPPTSAAGASSDVYLIRRENSSRSLLLLYQVVSRSRLLLFGRLVVHLSLFDHHLSIHEMPPVVFEKVRACCYATLFRRETSTIPTEY